jgi:hypothetical protein
MHLIILYVLGAVLVGYAGRNRRIGSVGFFLISLLITPILGFLIVVISAPMKTAADVHTHVPPRSHPHPEPHTHAQPHSHTRSHPHAPPHL